MGVPAAFFASGTKTKGCQSCGNPGFDDLMGHTGLSAVHQTYTYLIGPLNLLYKNLKHT